MKFTLSIQCDNEAFRDAELEVARLLRRTADHVEEQFARSGVLMDHNGNRVGKFTLTGRKRSD